MKHIPPKFSKLSEMASIDVGRLTENEARAKQTRRETAE